MAAPSTLTRGQGGMGFTAGDREEADRQIRVRFVTNLPEEMKVPATSITVPSNLTRLGLSEIINALLQLEKAVPFDFLIDGELVRMSLEKFLIAKGVSAEKVLDIEYIYAVAPQKQEDPCLHDDWVSAIDGSYSSFILSGCYDGHARVWKDGGTCTHVLEGHSGAITSVRVTSSKDTKDNDILHIATASKDHTLRLWKFNAADNVKHPKKVAAFKILKGHTSSAQCVSSDPSGGMICSGSWDCSLKLWHAKESDAEGGVVSLKKRKVDSETESHQAQIEEDAISTLSGHTQCVSSVVWPQKKTIYSASWDHSIKIWDVETGKDSTSLVCGKVLHCLDVGGESSALVAAGGSDTVLRIWDPRKPGTLAPVFQFSSHTSWIKSCKWHDKSWFHLLSGSYDGKVMVWDIRTAWPLTVLEYHEDKVLCADWWRSDKVISGGADSKLCISSGFRIL